MQCNQKYSNGFGVEELPVCLNSGFCIDLGKFHGKFSQPNCLCSDNFFGPNCEYRVDVLKPGRPIQPDIEYVAENGDGDGINKERKLVKPEIIGTVEAVDEVRVPRTRTGRMRQKEGIHLL